MKKYLFIILLVGVWSCEDKKEEDTTPPTVTITSPQNNSTVSGIVTITCMSSDNEGVEKVELWVDGVSTEIMDETEPYSFEWNTISTNNGLYTIIIRTYDINGNTSDSSPIILNVNNSFSTKVNIISVEYDLTEMVVKWSPLMIENFHSYKLLYSSSENGLKDTLITSTDSSITTHIITQFNPTIENWFWIELRNTYGQVSIGQGLSNTIDNPPISTDLSQILYYDGYKINWLKNNEDDFGNYKVYESLNDNMSNQILIHQTSAREDTTHIVSDISEDKYYQIIVEDIWGLQSFSNIEMGSVNIELWGVNYSIVNTTKLDLGNTGLTGTLPPELWMLTNLNELILYGNQFSGSIPTDIGNLNKLEVLDLRHSNLTGSIPTTIGDLTKLKEIKLCCQNLNGEIPIEIGNLIELEELDLSSNQFSGTIPSEIGNLIELELLYLQSNQLTGSLPSEIFDLINLKALILAANDFTGQLSSGIGNLTNLRQINIHNNNFSNSIPNEIGNLIGLIELNLSSNQFSGTIPPEIGNLTILNTLELYNNYLSGLIPTEICDLTNTYFWISNNQLCPPYPSCLTEDDIDIQDTSDCN